MSMPFYTSKHTLNGCFDKGGNSVSVWWFGTSEKVFGEAINSWSFAILVISVVNQVKRM